MPGSNAPRQPHDLPPLWRGAAIGAAALATALGGALSGASASARAQDLGSSPGCFTAPPPRPGPAASAEAGAAPKFRLITQQCPALADTGTAHLAELLARPEHVRPTTVLLTVAGAAAPTAAAIAAPPQPTSAAIPSEPLGKDGERIVSLAPALLAVARDHQLDPLLLHAIAHVESRHNPQAVSPAGARGLMQMMPATAQRFGVVKPETALHDAETNLRASAALLRSLQARYGADLRLVLAAYNAGEGAVAKYGNEVPPYRETQAYVRDVTAVYRRLSNEFTLTAGGSLVARQGS